VTPPRQGFLKKKEQKIRKGRARHAHREGEKKMTEKLERRFSRVQMTAITAMLLGKQISKSQRNGYGIDNPGGVGIVFKSGPDEALFVKALVPH